MKEPTKQQWGNEPRTTVAGLWMLAMELEGVPLGHRLEALERLAVLIVDAHGALSKLKRLTAAQQVVLEVFYAPQRRPGFKGIKAAVNRAGGSRGKRS